MPDNPADQPDPTDHTRDAGTDSPPTSASTAAADADHALSAGRKTIISYALLAVSLLVVGPVAGLGLTGGLRLDDGSREATPLVSNEPVAGLAAGVGAVLLAGLVGIVSARLLGPRVGLRNMGFVLAWAAWTTGTMPALARNAGGASPLPTLAIEAGVLGLLWLALCCLVLKLAAGVKLDHKDDISYGDMGRSPITRQLTSTLSLWGLVAILAGGAAGLGLAWVFAISPEKGQTVLAAILAGIGLAGVGRLAASVVRDDVPVLPVLIAGLLLAVGVPTYAVIAGPGGAEFVTQVNAATLFPPVLILPLDWLAGVSLGVPLGLQWVASLQPEPEPRPATA